MCFLHQNSAHRIIKTGFKKDNCKRLEDDCEHERFCNWDQWSKEMKRATASQERQKNGLKSFLKKHEAYSEKPNGFGIL